MKVTNEDIEELWDILTDLSYRIEREQNYDTVLRLTKQKTRLIALRLKLLEELNAPRLPCSNKVT